MSYSEADYTMAKTYIQSKITRMYLDDSEMSSDVKQALLLLSVQIHTLELPDIEEPKHINYKLRDGVLVCKCGNQTQNTSGVCFPCHDGEMKELNIPKDFDDLSGSELDDYIDNAVESQREQATESYLQGGPHKADHKSLLLNGLNKFFYENQYDEERFPTFLPMDKIVEHDWDGSAYDTYYINI